MLGATSQIARDLIISFSSTEDVRLHLFARRPYEVIKWLSLNGLINRYPVNDFSDFSSHQFEAIINFIGVSNPAQTLDMGNSIFDVTLHFDEMALNYLDSHPACRYLFLSSGAVYGSTFNEPVSNDTPAVVPVNNLKPQHWYGMAKLHAECRHRSFPNLSIIDIRVFNYFSRGQDISARFLITDIIRAIHNNTVLKTSAENIVRDYITPTDFFRLTTSLLSVPEVNTAIDCYSLAPIDKFSLLAAMHEQFGLQYEIVETTSGVNATGAKHHYYSLNKRAADFGYSASLTSLGGVIQEISAILQHSNSSVEND